MSRRHRITMAGALGLAGTLALATTGCGAVGNATPAAAKTKAETTAATSSQTITEKGVSELFTDWNAALATGDPEKVADRYASDAVLLPTVSNQVRTNRAEIVDYFVHFLENKPQGKILDSHINILDDNTVIDAGTYVFTLTQDGKQRRVHARYTYVYEQRDGRWLIVNHHSSVMPEG